jgi:hypothetical protein
LRGTTAEAREIVLRVLELCGDRSLRGADVREADQAEQQGRIETFLYDKSIEGGQVIPDEVRSSIRRCDEFLILLTPDSVGRQWVYMKELLRRV